MKITLQLSALLCAALLMSCGHGNPTQHHEHEEHAHEEHEHHGDAMHIDIDYLKGVEFQVDTARLEPFGPVISTMARVAPSQGDERIVTAKAAGVVTIAAANLTDGRQVKAGETLGWVDASGMATDNLQVRYQQAESSAQLAKQSLERKRELAATGVVSQRDLEQAQDAWEQARAEYDNLRKHFASGKSAFVAPMQGYVTQLLVTTGQYVEAGAPLLTISQNRDLLLRAEVASQYFKQLGHIRSARVRIPSTDATFSLEELGGKLVSYGHSVDADCGLLPVTFRVRNGGDLLPGAWVEMYLQTDGGSDAVSVPNTALVEEMGHYLLYVQVDDDCLEKRAVEVGTSDGERTEIKSGLKAGERYVSAGAIWIKLAQSSGEVDPHAGHVH